MKKNRIRNERCEKCESRLDFALLKKDYKRKYIKTPIPFLNHMIEHIAWRGEVNIDVDLKLDEFVLTDTLYALKI